MKIFLHICCAPCLIYFCKYFDEENISWRGYFFNPNIHPVEEFNKRSDCLKSFISQNNFIVDFEDTYRGQEIFVEKIGKDKEHWTKNKNDQRHVPIGSYRCWICYEWRLIETAIKAKKKGYEYFSTTLLISPYQDHDKIKELGEKIAKKFDLKFYYKDFRPFFREGKKMAKERGFYLQKYCGCLLSLV